MANQTLLYVPSFGDNAYHIHLKPLVGQNKVYVYPTSTITTIAELELYCKPRGITGIISTNTVLLTKLLERSHSYTPGKKAPSLSNYAGSYFKTPAGIEVVFIPPLDHLFKVNYGKHLAQRYISKLTEPDAWNSKVQFTWALFKPHDYDELHSYFSNCIAVAVDIETVQKPLAITIVGFAGINIDSSGVVTIRCAIVECNDSYNIQVVKNFCAIPVPKIFQNGKYDNAYLLRYNCPVHSYFWDTANLFHCAYSELPKDLASLSSYYIRESMYWKDLAKSGNYEDYIRYNALDCYNTAVVWCEQILQAKPYVITNYLEQFPVVAPAIACEMRGIKRDKAALDAANTEGEAEIESMTAKLQLMTGTPGFNSNSPKQVKLLLKCLGIPDAESTDEQHLAKYSALHPLNKLILTAILDLRGKRKEISTYLKPYGESEHDGRILYSLNPHGTDTGRLASKEHHFWCGLNIQNITRGESVKRTFIADDGFLFAEVDLKQAESRDTAYITGDTGLIDAVESSNDFHSFNTSKFFGVAYESVFDNATGKTLNKKLRDLAKRVNHGANYNMGAQVMLDTMGDEKVWEAKRLLNLPKLWSNLMVCEHLLAAFTRTYPAVRIDYPNWIKYQVKVNKRLTGPTGWTRICFGKPETNKLDLNSYIAHNPQSLNAQKLNRAFVRIFYEIQLPEKNWPNFKLNAQIHDSTLFQYRIGHEYLAQEVADAMTITIPCTDIKGITRTYTVPCDIKTNPEATHWHLTE